MGNKYISVFSNDVFLMSTQICKGKIFTPIWIEIDLGPTKKLFPSEIGAKTFQYVNHFQFQWLLPLIRPTGNFQKPAEITSFHRYFHTQKLLILCSKMDYFSDVFCLVWSCVVLYVFWKQADKVLQWTKDTICHDCVNISPIKHQYQMFIRVAVCSHLYSQC